MADSMLRQQPVSAMRWRYEDGFLLRAMSVAGEQAGAPRFGEAVMAYLNRWVQPDDSIDTYRLTEYSLDQVMPGRLLFVGYEATGEERFRRAIELLRQQLRWQPRTPAGGFWHKLIYPYQMWLDGIYMASPFLAQYAATFPSATFHEPAALDDVVHQVLLAEERTRDGRSGLLYHVWDESRQQAWCDPASGCSRHFWSRAVGWYVMAVVDVLDYVPEDDPRAAQLAAVLHRGLAAVLAAREPDTCLWRQVLDQGQRPGNYLEASSACMFVYALAKGIRRGWLPASWREAAQQSFAQILARFVQVDESGEVALHWTCGTAGLGGTPYRDGSYEYYISERVVTNDPKGVAAFILAASEMERA